jgi:hypothetical protein
MGEFICDVIDEREVEFPLENDRLHMLLEIGIT